MQSGSMNKLARPDCPACAGVGKLKVARGFQFSTASEVNAPPGQKAPIGFAWINCAACGGKGKR